MKVTLKDDVMRNKINDTLTRINILKSLEQENRQLQNNWNELKKWLEEQTMNLHNAIYCSNAIFMRTDDLLIKQDTIEKTLNKMQELQGEGNNEFV